MISRVDDPKRAGLRGAAPLTNALLLACFVTAVLATPGVTVKLAALALAVGLAAASGQPPTRFLQRLRFVILFATVLFVAQALSIREGSALFTIGIPITIGGVLAGATMALRFLVILTSSLLFVAVTDPDRLAGAITRTGIPYRYAFLLVLALRFAPLFQQEMRTVRDAQRIRGVGPSFTSPRGIVRAIRYTFLPVIVSGLTRVDSITMAMKGRAFGRYRDRTPPSRQPMTAMDGLGFAATALLVALVILSRRFEWP